MRDLWYKISKPGLVLFLAGTALLYLSLPDTIISFKPPKSFEDVMATGGSAGDHVQGQVPFLLDSFAVEQTWTENRSNNSVTPKKNSRYYFVLPADDGYLGVSVGSSSSSEAKKLADQTYGYLSGGAMPSATLVIDGRISQMEDDLASMFRRELKNTYGLSSQEISDMGPLMMIEPRAFTTIRVFCGAGAILFLTGIFLLTRYWREMNRYIN
ncbi:MAG: hypothetical protein HFI38_07410 [Lachnospiraceae bacterium]|jgi:hypothetical protein|nr:hypothetical protein [Lachnospiraceae bacterium]